MKIDKCAFTGHRPHKFPWKYDETDIRCVKLKTILSEQVSLLTESGITEYFSGMADGTDIWLSQIVLELKQKKTALKLHCLLPHEGQADKWGNSAQKRYYSILEQADSVEYVSHAYYDGCMMKRNHLLVESAGLLLAVYNGARRSGTGATVNYARKMGREIIVIDPISLNISHINRLEL